MESRPRRDAEARCADGLPPVDVQLNEWISPARRVAALELPAALGRSGPPAATARRRARPQDIFRLLGQRQIVHCPHVRAYRSQAALRARASAPVVAETWNPLAWDV